MKHVLKQPKHALATFALMTIAVLVFTSTFPQVADAQIAKESSIEVPKIAEIAHFPTDQDVAPAYEMWVLATAYSSDAAQTDASPCIPAKTSFNLCEYFKDFKRADTIAANFLPLDKQVRFELKGTEGIGDHVYYVRDRMNAKYNGTNRIDIWMPTRAQAIAFGVKRIKMKVYPYRSR